MKQLLINIQDDGTLNLYELNATVPSGMGVQLTELRTDRLYCPMKVELEPLYSGKCIETVGAYIQRLRKYHLTTVNDPPPPRIPWNE